MPNLRSRAEALACAAAGELLGPHEIAALWQISISRFYALNAAGAFDVFKVAPAIGPRCFSGAKIHRYLQGESFARPASLRRVRA